MGGGTRLFVHFAAQVAWAYCLMAWRNVARSRPRNRAIADKFAIPRSIACWANQARTLIICGARAAENISDSGIPNFAQASAARSAKDPFALRPADGNGIDAMNCWLPITPEALNCDSSKVASGVDSTNLQ